MFFLEGLRPKPDSGGIKIKSGGMNLKSRNGAFYLRKQVDGARKEISLGTDKPRDAKTKAARFLATLGSTGSWDLAAEELRGKKVLKKGESPTFDQMKELYAGFNGQSAKPVRGVTFTTNTNALRRLMGRSKANTVVDIRPDKIDFKGKRKTIESEIRHAKAIFKKTALRYYEKRGVKVHNPFEGHELGTVKRNPYTPLAFKDRREILEAARCLGREECLIVILALEIGLRKNEIDKARLSWIRRMEDHATFTVQLEDDFEPKTGAARIIKIPKKLAEEIIEIRNASSPTQFDPYIIPGAGRGPTRKDKSFRRVNKWLRSMGIKDTQPLHTLRKEFGSVVFTSHGLGVAGKLLGHADVNLTMDTYAGLTALPVIDLGVLVTI